MFKSKERNVPLLEGCGLSYALTWPWNLLNRYPIVDVPLGIVEDRMPAGMQVIGQTFTDPCYPGHYALVDTGRLAADQLERLADEIRSS